MEKGILTSEQEKVLSEKLDEIVKLKGFLELIDGMVFRSLITFIDNTYVDKLAVDVKTKLAALVDAILDKDIETAENIATDIINILIDVPGLDEEAEGLLFKGVIQILVAAILKWIESRKNAPVLLSLNR